MFPCLSLFPLELTMERDNDVLQRGASMMKWTWKVLPNTKTIIVLINSLKVVVKCCLIWICFHDGLYCCVQYLNVIKILKLTMKTILKNKWLNLVLDVNFMTFNALKLNFFHIR